MTYRSSTSTSTGSSAATSGSWISTRAGWFGFPKRSSRPASCPTTWTSQRRSRSRSSSTKCARCRVRGRAGRPGSGSTRRRFRRRHRHAVGMAGAALHVLLADVVRAPLPVVVRVVAVARDEGAERGGEVLQEAVIELVDPHGADRCGASNARDTVLDTAFANGLLDRVKVMPRTTAACMRGPCRPGIPSSAAILSTAAQGSGLAVEVENVVVRRPTLDDASGVAALLAARDRADCQQQGPSGSRATSCTMVGDGRAALATERWIALRDGEIIGYAWGAPPEGGG